jgi:hypothetical protein
MKNAYNTLVRKPEGKRLHGGLKHRLEDNIKRDLEEIGHESVDWILLAQVRGQQKALAHGIETSVSIK